MGKNGSCETNHHIATIVKAEEDSGSNSAAADGWNDNTEKTKETLYLSHFTDELTKATSDSCLKLLSF